MQNDTLETLLLRHYGDVAPAPHGLEAQLQVSLQQQVYETQLQQRQLAQFETRRFSRRRAVALVALGTAGVGFLSATLEGLQVLEAALVGQDVSQNALP